VVQTIDAPEWVIGGAARLSWCAMALHVAAWTIHSAVRLGRGIGRLAKAALAVMFAVAVTALLPGALLTNQITHHVWAGIRYAEAVPGPVGVGAGAMLLAAFALPLTWHLRAVRTIPDSTTYLAIMGCLWDAGANDTLVGTGRYALPYVLDEAFLMSFGIIGYMLIRRFVEGSRRLDALSSDLETMMGQRTNELGRAQEALAQAERMAAIGRLCAGVAHEINNPAAAVTANLKYLEAIAVRQGSLPPDANEAIRDTLASMEKIARIVRQLLDTGRIANAAPTMRSKARVGKAVRSAVRMARASAGDNVNVAVEIPEDLWAVGDAHTLEQVLLNLIVNAMQAMPEGKEAGIEVRARREMGLVLITVADNGMGMTPDVQRRAFEPFFTTKPFGKGTGLGLSVSVGLVRALGGELYIARTTEQGTTMAVELAETSRGPSSPPAFVAAQFNEHKRVLVIDDERPIRDALRRMLSRSFDVEVASNVAEGLAKVEQIDFDVVLCDLMMTAGGGGEELFEALCQRAPAIAKRLVFVTGGATDDRSRAFLERQGQPVLYKPLDPAALEQAMQSIFENRPADVEVIAPVLKRVGER
jgi:signal transduction histidine kinase/ActR/RegA family two-component response regulator